MHEKLNAKVIEISSSNDIYITLQVLLLTNQVNLNKAIFSNEFIDYVVKNKDYYIGLPLVAERYKLERNSKSLTHAYDRNGDLNTDQIGSYVDFYKSTDDNGVVSLFGTARVSKRFALVCEAIQKLYDEDALFFSIECLVAEYIYNSDGTRIIDNIAGNELFGDCIVSKPAEERSKAHLLIAEALNIDLGGDKLNIEKFFKDSKIVDINELDINKVQSLVYAKCCEMYEECCDMYCLEIGTNYMILNNYENTLFKVDFLVVGDEVTVSDCYEVNKSYVRVGGEPVEDVENSSEQAVEEVSEIEESVCKEKSDDEVSEIEDSGCGKKKVMENETSETENAEEISTNEQVVINEEIAEVTAEVIDNSKEIAELKEQLSVLSESLIQKDREIAELNEYKIKLDELNKIQAEKELSELKISLRSKYSEILSDEVLSRVEIAEAIENLNESVLQNEVVKIALEKANSKKSEVKKVKYISSKISDDIAIESNNIINKYITIK